MYLDTSLIEHRITKLKKRYYAACRLRSQKGEPITPSSAQQIRASTLRDMDILQLLRCVIDEKPITPEAERGWLKLVTPVERHNKED